MEKLYPRYLKAAGWGKNSRQNYSSILQELKSVTNKLSEKQLVGDI